MPLATDERVPGKAELLTALGSGRFDVVITEARLSWIDGFDVLRAVKERQPDHPVLMVTARGDEDLAVSALIREIVDVEAVRDSLSTMIRAAEDGAEAVRRLLLFARPGDRRITQPRRPRRGAARDREADAPRWRGAAQQEGRPLSVDLGLVRRRGAQVASVPSRPHPFDPGQGY